MKDGNRTRNSGAEVPNTRPSFSLLHALSPACKGNTTNALAIFGLLQAEPCTRCSKPARTTKGCTGDVLQAKDVTDVWANLEDDVMYSAV